MQYVDCVNQEVARSGASLLNKRALPFDVVADSLALKQQGTEFTEKFPGITSPEDQRLLNSRIGSTLARVATASYIAAQNGADVEYFGALSKTAQDDVKYKVTKRYKKLYKRTHDWIDNVDPFAIVQDNDPLPALPNATMRSIVAQSKRAAMTPADRLRAFGSYLNVIPGSFPPESWPSTDYALNDVTLTQAFGRNDIPDKELPKIRDERDAAKDDESVMRYLESISSILGQQGVWADVLASEVPFDARSIQAQVRGPLPWTIRETATRAEHVLFNRVKF